MLAKELLKIVTLKCAVSRRSPRLFYSIHSLWSEVIDEPLRAESCYPLSAILMIAWLVSVRMRQRSSAIRLE